MKRKLIILIAFGLAFSNYLTAQQIVRQSLSCLGTNNISEGVLLRQTIGQSSSTSTIASENGTLRQGFQQPLSSNNARYFTEELLEMTVFPNPTEQDFYINIGGEQSIYNVIIVDVFGKVLYNGTIENRNKTLINSANWTAGMYFINVYSEKKLLATKKLIKTA